MVNSFDKVFMGAAGGGEDLPSDDQFNRTSFLSHFEGANNGVNNAFDDGSASNHTITANGNVTQGSFGPFARPDGEWGVDLTPSGGFLRATGAGDISGDFTIETWVYMNKDNGNYIHFTYNSGGLMNVFNVYNGSVQNFLFGTSSTAGQTTLVFNDTTWDAGVWTHLAAVRSSGTLKIYVNGVADATTSTAVSGNLTDLEYIGTGRGFTDTPNSRLFDGIVSNVRFSSTARYTSNFTPPTAPFTTDSDTNLLTCQSNRFVDNSSNGHTITPAGSAAVTAFGPFLTSSVYDPAVNGASARFSADGDDLISATVNDSMGTGDFCLEGWAWSEPNTHGISIIIDTRGGSGGTARPVLAIHNQGKNLVAELPGGNLTSANSLNQYEWNHVAAVRNSETVTLYVNGVAYGTTVQSSTDFGTVPNYRVGVDDDGGPAVYHRGYLGDTRVVLGSPVYTSNFTPPTAPLTAITNTKLLLNMADAQAIDSAAQTNLTLFGNAKLSTGQAKFGDTSLLLDGTGDFVHLHNRRNLSGPFCIEAFARADDTTTAYLWCLGQYRLELGIDGNNLQIYRVGTSTGYTSFFTGGEFTANNWHHVALVRDTSNVIKCYLNGTASSTTITDAAAFVATDNIFIIGGEASGTPSGGAISHGWDGYIDDFRISNFARYTSNFTAPAEPFPDKGQ